MSTIQRHNTFGDTAMTCTHAQLQSIVDELRGRQKTAEDAPNDERVNFAIGRAVAYNDAADLVQALLSGARS
jgi:hypothetical protein